MPIFPNFFFIIYNCLAGVKLDKYICLDLVDNFCNVLIYEPTKPPYSSVTASDYRSKDGLVSELAELVVRCRAIHIYILS